MSDPPARRLAEEPIGELLWGFLVLRPPLRFGLDGLWTAGPVADTVASLLTGLAL
jgi:hypothetical protein